MKFSCVILLCFIFLPVYNIKAQDDKLKMVLPIGHTGSVNSAVFSPDGKKVVTASDDKTAIIWDAVSSRLLLTLEGHTDGIYSAVYSPDGNNILTTSDDNTSKLWDAITGKILHSFEGYFAKFSPDGKKIVTTSGLNVNIWDVLSGKLLQKLSEPEHLYLTNFFHHTNFSPDSKKIVTSSQYGKTTKIWNVENGKLIRSIKNDKEQPVSDAKFSPACSSDPIGGKYMVITSGQESQYVVKIWDAENGKLFKDLSDVFWSGTRSVVLSPDGTKILQIQQYYVQNWDVKSVSLLNVLELGDFRESIYSAQFSPDGHKIAVIKGGSTFICDANTGKMLQKFDAQIQPKNVAFSPDGKKIAISSYSGFAKIWDVESGKSLGVLGGYSSPVGSACFSPDGKKILTTSSYPTIWDAQTSKILLNITGDRYDADFTIIRLSPDGKKLLTANKDENVKIWSSETGKKLLEIKITDFPYSSIYIAEFSMDGKYILAVVAPDEFISIWDAMTGKLIQYTFDHGYVSNAVFSTDGEKILISNMDSLLIWDWSSNKIINAKYEQSVISEVFCLANYQDSIQEAIVTVSSRGKVKIYDSNKFELKKEIELSGDVITAEISKDRKKIITTSFDDTVRIFDAETGRGLMKLIGHTGRVISAHISPDGNKIITASDDETIKIWDAESGSLLYTFFLAGYNVYLVQLPSKFYYCNPVLSKLIHYVTPDLNVITFDQLDVKYNRPDKVLQSIGDAFGSPDTILIKSYYYAYLKRIKKLGIDTSSFQEGYSIPEAEFANRDSIQYEQSKGQIKLHLSAFDSVFPIDRFNIWVNESPVFGFRGISVRNRMANTMDTSIVIDLSQGENQITTSITNVNGIESYKIPLYVRYTPELKEIVESKTYFIGIGVSQYKDSSRNLTYAVKDIQDLKGTFPGAEVTILLNEQATRENILALKQKLLQTNIEDKVIISVSGHGLLSDSLDFYFATHDMDFSKPEKRGLLFDDLENLLDSIPARKKLLMIDACHSGEVDKDEVKIDKSVLAANNVKEIDEKDKGGQTLVNKNSIGLQNTFELMQSLFANVSKGTGAVVISAAGGKEYALESGKWNNGVFTYCVRKALEEKAADTNKNNEVSISELKDYVSKEVERLTQGRQKPTARKENLEVDWRVK